jgi:FSR family fosmidomycin resistance protein-like MFS transporter
VFIQKEFGVSYVALGLVITAYNLIGGVIQAPVGFLVDRYGARYLLLAGFAVNALAVGLIGLVDGYWMLLVLAVLAGIGNSVFHPANYAILSASVAERKVGRAFGIHTFSGFFGGAVAPVTMGAMAAFWGWRAALIVAGAAGLAAVLGMGANGRMLETAAHGDAARRAKAGAKGVRTGWALLLTPAMLLFFALFYSITFTTSGLYAFTISGLIELRGTPYAVANAALTGFLLLSSFGVLLGGFLADRVGRHDLMATIFLVLAAVTVVLPAYFDLPVVLLMVALSVSGLAFGTVQPARDMLVRAITPSGEMGKVFGFLSVGMSTGAATAPLLFGWALDQGSPQWVFLGAGFFMLITLLAALAGRVVGIRTGLRRA